MREKKKKKPYHVTYYYLATGMEGLADTHDYGVIWAMSKEEAINLVAKRRGTDWGLSAKEV